MSLIHAWNKFWISYLQFSESRRQKYGVKNNGIRGDISLWMVPNEMFTSYEQPIRISNFYNEIFVYLLFEGFIKVKVFLIFLVF